MTKKAITPDNESVGLVTKLQAEVARLKKKIDRLENDLLKSEHKYLKLDIEMMKLRKQLLESGPPEGLAEAMKQARERARKHSETDVQNKKYASIPQIKAGMT
jgi:predicted nuclease with TOPRIM domain